MPASEEWAKRSESWETQVWGGPKEILKILLKFLHKNIHYWERKNNDSTRKIWTDSLKGSSLMSFIHRINNYLLSPCHVLGSFRFSNEQGPCAHRAQGNRQPSSSPTITWNLRFLGGSDTKTGGAGEAGVQDILDRRKGMYIGLEVRQKAPPSRQTAKLNLDEMWLWGVVLSLSHVQLFCDPWTVWLFSDAMNYSPPGSSALEISQARILE